MGFKFLWVISWVFEIKIKSVKESLSLLKWIIFSLPSIIKTKESPKNTKMLSYFHQD
jgi:hypothetical protein